MADNKVFMNEEGFGEMILIGEQTRDSLFRVFQEMLVIDNALSVARKPVHTLVNLEQMTAWMEEAQKCHP